jgi:hypothetical protein
MYDERGTLAHPNVTSSATTGRYSPSNRDKERDIVTTQNPQTPSYPRRVKCPYRGINAQELAPGCYRYRWRIPRAAGIEKRQGSCTVWGTHKQLLEAARDKHDELLLERSKLRRARHVARYEGRASDAAPVPVTARYAIVDEPRARARALQQDTPDPNRSTGYQHWNAARFFLRWCEVKGLVYMDELTEATLAEWREHRCAELKPNGEPYLVSARNQTISKVKTMLRGAARAKRFSLTYQQIADALPTVPVNRKKHRVKYGLKHGARPLSPAEVRDVLDAAVAFDQRDRTLDRPSRRKGRALPVAPDIALLLVTGTRCEEYTFTKVAEAFLDNLEHAIIKITPELDKNSEGRSVRMRGFSEYGRAIVAAMTKGRRPNEWLSYYRYQAIRPILATLHELYGCALVTPHDLRATAVTYTGCIKDMDSHRNAERYGHDWAIQHAHYFEHMPGMKFGAMSLEDAMCARKQFARVVKLAAAWPAAPRREYRPPTKATGDAAVLLSDNAQLLNDALWRGVDRAHVA